MSDRTNLERRYRMLLKVLPKWYRQDREEEMVGLFLADRSDELDLEHSWPGWGETFAMLGLAVRTHLAAGSVVTGAPVKAVWRGEIVRALGMLGLLLGIFYAGAMITSMVWAYNNSALYGGVVVPFPWWRVLDLGPIVAFVALLDGRRTLAKVAAFVAILPAVASLGEPDRVLLWLLYQLPSVVTFVALCLGFHRDAPTPPVRRLRWWGGGALALGVLGGLMTGVGLMAVAVIIAITRVVAYVRGDVVLGRALSVLAVLMLTPLVFLLIGGEVFVPAVVVAALMVLSAAAPVRRASAPGFRLP